MVNIQLVIIVFIIIYIFYNFIKFYYKNRNTQYEFTSIINHTFRTPLTRINWISKELERLDLSVNEKLLYIQNLNNATNKLLNIIDLIVGVDTIDHNNKYLMGQGSFRSIVEESIARYREDINNKNITFKVSTFQDIPFIILDSKKIGFVVDTLIENAITYTPKNGKILIDCVYRPKKGILFYISDTGIGLSFYDRLKLFSKFFRSQRARHSFPDGMGLRLYLAKQIIMKHKGEIYAKSKGRNKGSVFFIKFPLKK